VSSTSDSIFLLGGVFNVVLFCTIRRVTPIREVATALFTGRVFQKQEKSLTDMGTGEKRISADLSNDYFALRQPKVEIVAPPPAVLHDNTLTSTTTQAAQLTPAIGTEGVVHANSPQPPRTRSIPRKPLPREPSIYGEGGEGYDRSPLPRQSLIRRLPSIPRGSRPGPLPSVAEKWESPPPPHRSSTPHSEQYSFLSSVPSHGHSGSLDSVASDLSLLSGSVSFGPTDGDNLKGDGSPVQT